MSLSGKTTILKTTPWHLWPGTAPTAVETTSTTVPIPLETVVALPARTLIAEGLRGMRIRFITNGADNETATVTFYGIDPQEKDINASPRAYYATNLGNITLTFGTEVGVANTMVPQTMRYADTPLTWTAETFGTGILTYVGGNVADVEVANNIGELMMSDVGNFAGMTWRVTTYGLTEGSSINLVCKLDV